MARKKDQEKYCKYCGKKLVRKRYNGVLQSNLHFSRQIYCDRECMKKDYIKKDAKKQSFTNAHTSARLLAGLTLKKEKCASCGKIGKLDLHHKDLDWKNNSIENFIYAGVAI